MGKTKTGIQEGFRTSGRERWAFALFMSGQTMFNQLFNAFGQKFMTDMGIAAVVVGIIITSVRIFDAINDPIFGGIIDRAHLKGGKFIPWLKLSAFLLPLCTIGMYFMPASLNIGSKIAWAAVFSTLFSVAYTICDVPIFSMLTAVTDNSQERVQIISFNSIIAAFAMLIALVGIPALYPKIGWNFTSLFVIALAFPLMLAIGRHGRERYVNKDPEKVTIKAMFNYVKINPHMRTYFIGLLIFFSTSTTGQAAVYFADYNLGNPAMQGQITLAMFVPALIFVIILPMLTRHIDKFKIFMFCLFGQVFISIVSFFVGYGNIALFTALMAVRGIFWGGNTMMMNMFNPDFIEFGEYKTGKRLQGTMNSLQTFIYKLFTAIAGGFVMFILSWAGFREGGGIAQPQLTLDSIWFLVSLMPAVGGLVSLVFFLRYRLRDRDVQLMAKVNSGELAREEAEAKLSRNY
ncbi:MAG: MFS transporter [Oscillospiraceae bacterium]|nr:MFS transporter [Oscillospiraceae bacterium]